jgi:hypothetical protein
MSEIANSADKHHNAVSEAEEQQVQVNQQLLAEIQKVVAKEAEKVIPENENTLTTFDNYRHILSKYPMHKTTYCDQEMIGSGIPEIVNSKQEGFYLRVSIPYVAPYGNSKYTVCTEVIKIPFFMGRMRIGDLPVQPFFNWTENEELAEPFVVRGQNFIKYTKKPYYCHAKGFMYVRTWMGKTRLPINSRVVVDPAGYKKYCDANSWHNNEVIDKVPDELSLNTLPCVPVYSLEYRRWGEVPVDQLDEINFDETAFERTILPQEYKKRISSLVTNFYNTECMDFIAGKKRGMVFLLNGKPGTGKTLTAQGISELTHRPLYAIGAGDLGSKPETIENELQRIFDMVGKWNGIVLIDEADVFMSERVDHDVTYNACVSVFLRLIESYYGILFLTTNRDHSIDPAFESRIHVKLKYPELEAEGRAKVWSESFQRYNITTVDVDKVKQVDLNNREIANIVQLAYIEADGNPKLVSPESVDYYISLRSK